jgi:hypothetical protein
VGTFTVDGGTYNVYTNLRVNQPSIEGDKTFIQYFSIRQDMTTERRQCGTISVTEHFKKWEELGLALGNNIYECKFLVEAGSGAGWIDLSYLSFSQEDKPRNSDPDPPLTSDTSSKLYVNMVNSNLDVYFTATGSGKTALKLHSVTGSLVASTELQTVAGEDYSYTFNQGNLPVGIYILSMSSNGNVEQTKVVIPK